MRWKTDLKQSISHLIIEEPKKDIAVASKEFDEMKQQLELEFWKSQCADNQQIKSKEGQKKQAFDTIEH